MVLDRVGRAVFESGLVVECRCDRARAETGERGTRDGGGDDEASHTPAHGILIGISAPHTK